MCSEMFKDHVPHPVFDGQSFNLTARSCQCDSLIGFWNGPILADLKWFTPSHFQIKATCAKAPVSSVLCDEYLKEMNSEHPLWYFQIMWSISSVPIVLSVVLACWSLLCKALVPLIMICLEGPVAPQCMTNALITYKLNRPLFSLL